MKLWQASFMVAFMFSIILIPMTDGQFQYAAIGLALITGVLFIRTSDDSWEERYR